MVTKETRLKQWNKFRAELYEDYLNRRISGQQLTHGENFEVFTKAHRSKAALSEYMEHFKWIPAGKRAPAHAVMYGKR